MNLRPVWVKGGPAVCRSGEEVAVGNVCAEGVAEGPDGRHR